MVLVILSLSFGSSWSKDIFVSDTGAGAANGTSASNAYPFSWLKSAQNWGGGASGVQPGDRVNLVGNFATTFEILGSGTPGNPITILFAPGAKFSAPTLPPNSSWISLADKSWITIDGGTNGRVELTDNGTPPASGGTKSFQNPNIAGIHAAAGSGNTHLEIKNLQILNMYFRQSITEPKQGQGDGVGVLLKGSDITLSNCFISGCENGISAIYGNPPSSNLTVVSCTISNYNHGLTLGSGGVVNPFFSNFIVKGNTFEGGDMFESPDGVELGLHRNPIFLFNESPDRSGSISNVIISHNFIRHGVAPKSSTAGTGAMFFDFYNNEMATHVRVFNNVSKLVAPLSWSGGGGFISGAGNDVLVANNTAIGWITNGVWKGGEISAMGTNVFVYNNMVLSGRGVTLSTFADTRNLTNDTATIKQLYSKHRSDANIFNGQGANSFYEIVYTKDSAGSWHSGLVDSLTQWKNIWGGALSQNFDPNSTSQPVTCDANGVPMAGDVVAVGKGLNLASWGINDDFNGKPRPTTGPWTIGAYESLAATSAATKPAPPTNLRVQTP
jgi:hypothetical protein